MPKASAVMSTYKPCTAGYRLHCSDGKFELYNKQRADTFIYIVKPPAASGAQISASIALQKISGRVQKASQRYRLHVYVSRYQAITSKSAALTEQLLLT